MTKNLIFFFFCIYCFSDPMELMEQQLVRCGVPPVRLYEHLALTAQHQQSQSPHHHQQQQQSAAQQTPQQAWLSPSTALLYGVAAAAAQSHQHNIRGGAPPIGYPTSTANFPYSPVGIPWPWQPSPVTATAAALMARTRASPPTSSSNNITRLNPYPSPTSTPPELNNTMLSQGLRTRPSTP